MSSCRRNEIDLRHGPRGWVLIMAAEHFVFSRQLIWSRLSGAPGRPGEFHPEPPTDPDVNLSIHPARATQRRLPPPIRTGSPPGGPLPPPALVALSLCSTGITPFHRSYEAVRP